MSTQLQKKITPLDYPSNYNEWRLYLEIECDRIYGTEVALKTINRQAEELIDQANEVLVFSKHKPKLK